VLDDADAVHVSGRPTVRALGSPRGPHVMLPTPGPPYKRSGLGAVHDHSGETVGLVRRRKRRRDVAERLQAVVDRPPTGTSSMARETADTHVEDAVEAVVRAAAGRLVLLYVPTDRPAAEPACAAGAAVPPRGHPW
jgi:putative transposase